MQNDLKTSLNSAINQQIFMIIGQQKAGKSLLIQKFSETKKLAFPDSKIAEYDIELLDTPSYDSFFTLLPYRNPSVTGYIIMFSQHNYEILQSIQQIRQKLFTINGFHKQMVIIFNEFQTIDNYSSQIEQEIIDTIDWCKNSDILFLKQDIQQATQKDIVNIFEKIFLKKKRASTFQKCFLIFQFSVPAIILLFDVWLSIKDPSIIISNLTLEIYCLLILCLGILHIFIPYYLRKGIVDQNETCILRSKIVSCVVTAISLLSLFFASLCYILMSCLIMSIIFTTNSVICLIFAFHF